MVEFGTAEDFAEFMKQEREENLIPFDLDYVWMNCGPERTGKSTLAIYVGCKIDPHFNIDHIGSDMVGYTKTLYNSEYAKKVNPKLLGSIPRGSFVVKDESIDTYAREFYSKDNIFANKILMTSGCMNLMHCIITPKPIAQDQYIREERSTLLTYSYYIIKGDYPNNYIERWLLVYFREKLNKIYSSPNWWNYFWDHKVLEKHFKPDGKFKLHNLVKDIEAMKPGLLEAYQLKKGTYVLNNIEDYVSYRHEKDGKVGFNRTEKQVAVRALEIKRMPGLTKVEQIKLFEEETGFSRTDFYRKVRAGLAIEKSQIPCTS